MLKNIVKWISTLLLLNYVVIALFISLTHCHEEDYDFHDNCPACLWEMQSRDTDSVTSFVLDSILNPHNSLSHIFDLESESSSSQFFLQSQGSRAPPAS